MILISYEAYSQSHMTEVQGGSKSCRWVHPVVSQVSERLQSSTGGRGWENTLYIYTLYGSTTQQAKVGMGCYNGIIFWL